MGEIAGESFDRIVIREGHYLRGREAIETAGLLQEGIARSGKEPQVRIIPESREAIQHAIKYARKNELVVTLADIVPDDIRYIHEIRDKVLEDQQRAAEG